MAELAPKAGEADSWLELLEMQPTKIEPAPTKTEPAQTKTEPAQTETEPAPKTETEPANELESYIAGAMTARLQPVDTDFTMSFKSSVFLRAFFKNM